jgi:hypothetical protein
MDDHYYYTCELCMWGDDALAALEAMLADHVAGDTAIVVRHEVQRFIVRSLFHGVFTLETYHHVVCGNPRRAAALQYLARCTSDADVVAALHKLGAGDAPTWQTPLEDPSVVTGLSIGESIPVRARRPNKAKLEPAVLTVVAPHQVHIQFTSDQL